MEKWGGILKANRNAEPNNADLNNADLNSASRSALWVRLVMTVALLASTAGAVLVGLVATAAPAAAQTCTGDMWLNTGGGLWDTGSNWSNGSPPTGTQVGCITATGSYTVTIGNETIAAGALTVGGSGSTPTLAIGNTGSGLANVTFASVTNAGSIEPQSEASFTVPGTFTNTGTFEVPTSTLTGVTIDIGNLDNQGQFVIDDTSTYELPTTSSTLLNDSTGTLSVASSQSLVISSPSGQTGTVTQDGVIDNSGTLTIQDAFGIEGGSICGTAPHVGVDGQSSSIGTSLAFASTVTTGPTCSLSPTDNVFIANVTGTLSGNIPAAYTVAIGDGGSSLPSITLSGPITNSGTFEPGFGGTFTGTSAFTNSGTFEVPASGSTSTFDLASLTNNKTLTIDGNTDYTLPTSSSSLLNASAGTLTVATGESLSISSPSGQTGTVTQDGVIDNSGTLTIQDAVSIEGGSICGTAPRVGVDGQSSAIGTSLAFASTVTTGPTCSLSPKDNVFIANVTGTLSGNIPAAYTVIIGDGGSTFANVTISGAVTNSGTLEPGWGGTVTDTSAFTNSGTFVVPASGYVTYLDFTSFTNKKTLTFDAGSGYSLPTSASTLANDSTGTITVASAESLSMTSPSGQIATVTQDGVINNSGSLTIQDALTIKGGSICGNAPHIGVDGQSSTVGGSLKFASTVTTGPACATSPTDNLFIANITGTLSGNVPAAYKVVLGDGGSGYFHVTASSTTNAGTLEPGFGGTLTFTGALTNSGTLEVPASGYNTTIDLGGNLTNSGKITLDAAGTIAVPSGDSVIDSATHSKIKVAGSSVTFDVTGSLAGTLGQIQIGAGDVLAVSGTYTQGSSAKLKPALASTSSYGVLKVTGTASLAGTLAPKDVGGFTPPVSSTYLVLTSAGLGSTTFGTVTGAFTASYVSSDSDVQLTAT
jgi:fibronectin-binding autotransporter adhesin